MIENINPSTKETSKISDADSNETPTTFSLNSIIEHIRKVSNSNIEIYTPGPFNESGMRVTGDIKKPALNGHLILNPDGVDLRIISGKIKSVEYEKISGDRYKATFKDHDGNNVLHISFNSKEKIDCGIKHIFSRQLKMEQPDTQKSIEELWRSLKDVHHFYSMLQQHGISKLDAFRLVPEDLARQVDPHSLMLTLNDIQNRKDHFMAFIGNGSVVQVYTGPVLKIAQVPKSDKLFIHGMTNEGEHSVINISKKDIGQAWVVNKGSDNGYITSLEIFDHNGNHIAQFYGVRKEGQKQNEAWDRLMKSLPKAV